MLAQNVLINFALNFNFVRKLPVNGHLASVQASWNHCFFDIGVFRYYNILFTACSKHLSKQILYGNFMLFYKEMKYRSIDIFMDVNKHEYHKQPVYMYTHCVVHSLSLSGRVIPSATDHFIAICNQLLMLISMYICVYSTVYAVLYTIIDVSVVHDLSILWT